MSLQIGAIDLGIIIAYMLAVLLFGVWVGRRGDGSAADYFLGNRSLPMGALLLSIVATETSTVTFLSIPGIAFAVAGDLTFLQITLGYIIGRLFVVFYLLPLYFQGKPFTAYEVLESRFGPLSRRLVSCLFLLTRNASDALRLFLTAMALQVVLGLDMSISVLSVGLVTIVYTFLGGARSVIWNDCIQFVIYIVGALAIAVIIVSDLPGGLNGLMQFASEENKLRLFDFELSLVKPGMTFWAGLAGGIFLTAATHGTDQMMVQRYLSARNQSDAGLALGLSGFVVLLQFALFLLIGVALAGFFSLGSETMVAGVKNDQALAYFIVHYMPVGLLGVTLAAVFAAAMSTLSSSLNASAAALINDLYLPLQKNKQEDEGAKDKRAVNGGLLATIAFGIVQIGLALAFGQLDSSESIVGNVLKISGLAAGPVLGLYFMGVFVKRLDQRPAITGFVLGLLTVFAVAYSTSVYWPWYAFIGSVATLTGGLLAGLLMGRRHG